MKSNNPSTEIHSSLIPKWVKALFLFLAILLVVVVVQKIRQPRYQGQTMDEWLQVFVQDKPKWGWGPELTLRQQLVADAFEHFGQDGFDYLTERVTYDLSALDEVYIWLNQFNFIDELGMFPDRRNDKAALKLLRAHLRVPFEWIELHLNKNDTNTPEMICERMRLMRSVTNRLDELVPIIAPHINHNDRVVRIVAMNALDNCYAQGAHYPGIEPMLIQFASNPSQVRWDVFTQIMIKHAQQSEWAQDYWKDNSNDPDIATATRALMAMMTIPNLRASATQKLGDLLHKTAHAPGFRRPSQNSDLHHMLFELTHRDIQMDPTMKPILIGLLEVLGDSSMRLDIPDIFRRQGWMDEPEIVEYVRQCMIPRRGVMSNQEFHAFDWLLERDPEDEEVWRAYDRIMESTVPSEVAINLRELRTLPKSSKAAVQRLKHYANSDRDSYRRAATETLSILKDNGFLDFDEAPD